MKPSIQPFLKQLLAARRRQGLSQQELGTRTGLPQSYLSRIERGQVDIGLSILIQLARALDLEVMLIPRPLVPAIESLRRKQAPSSSSAEPGSASPAYRLDEDDES